MGDISKLDKYSESESEISLSDIVEFVQDSWNQLVLAGIAEALLVFSGWFFLVVSKLSYWFKIMAALILPLVVMPKKLHPISQRKLGGGLCSCQDYQRRSGNFHQRQLIYSYSCRSQTRLNNPGTTPCVMIEVQSGGNDREDDIDSVMDQHGRVR